MVIWIVARLSLTVLFLLLLKVTIDTLIPITIEDEQILAQKIWFLHHMNMSRTA